MPDPNAPPSYRPDGSPERPAGTPPTPAPPTPAPAGAPAPAAAPPAVTFDPASEARIRQLYPHLAIYLDHPELGPILRRAAQEGWSAEQLQGAVWQTEWWRTTSANARTWDALGQQDPAEAQRRRDTRRAEVESETQRLGLMFEPLDVNHVVENSLRQGMSATEITRFIISMATSRGFQVTPMGSVRSTANEIGALARQYLMPLAPGQAQDLAMRVASGSLSMDGVTAWFASVARQRFVNDPQVVANLDQGLTPSDIFGPNVAMVASELGLDPTAVDLAHPRFGVLMESRQPDGSVRSMTPTEARQWARTQPEWERSEGAQTEGTQLVTAVLDFMGLR